MCFESQSYQDLVQRIDSLESLEGLSLLVHRPSDKDRVLGFMIAAYGDESADSRVTSLSILLAKLRDFVELERQWKAMLLKKGIPEFHASHLEFAHPPLYDKFDREQRDDIQRSFIGLITGLDIWGWHAYVELEAWRQNRAELERLLPGGQTNNYMFPFRMIVEEVAKEVDGYEVRNEPIAFVFDQQKQHEGKAKEIYDHLSVDGNWPLAHRLGSITFGKRQEFLCIQAADAWAYEARKDVSDKVLDQCPERWQMSLFRGAGRFNSAGHTQKTIPLLLEHIRAEYQARGIHVP